MSEQKLEQVIKRIHLLRQELSDLEKERDRLYAPIRAEENRKRSERFKAEEQKRKSIRKRIGHVQKAILNYLPNDSQYWYSFSQVLGACFDGDTSMAKKVSLSRAIARLVELGVIEKQTVATRQFYGKPNAPGTSTTIIRKVPETGK